jgi:hypothetical protein
LFECQGKGKKLAAFLGTAKICQLFYLAEKKCHNNWYLILFLMRISEWGLPFLYLLYLKSYCEKTEEEYFCAVW